jgi:hypothetical protein
MCLNSMLSKARPGMVLPDDAEALLDPANLRTGPIDDPKTVADVRQEPYNLPNG